MGVSYKLTDEIVDFIVQNKRNFPALSCRQLVSKVTEKFRVDVSKSSVNDVIKEFKLSNPVGRQPRIKPPKNFSIPKDKKDVLLNNVIPFLVEEQNIAPESPFISENIQKSDVDAPILPEIQKNEEALVMETNVQNKGLQEEAELTANVHLLPDPVSVAKDRGLPIHSRLGSSVLWYALRSLADTVRLGGIISKWSRLMECDPEVALSVPLLPFFNNDTLENTDDSLLTLWKLCEASEAQTSKLQYAAQLFHQLPQAQADFLKEIQKSEIPVKGLCIKADSGHEFHLAAQSSFLYENGQFINDGFGWPVFSATKRAVDQVITNITPIELEHRGDLSDKILGDFILWVRGSLSGASSLDIYDENGRMEINLGSIPVMQRKAVIKVSLSENEAEMFESGVGVQNNIFWDEITHQNVHYKESLFSIKNLKEPQTIITFGALEEKAFFILLHKDNATLKCAFEYFLKGSFKESEPSPQRVIYEDEPGSKNIIEKLERMILKAMLSFENQENLVSHDIWNAFYQLPGRIIYGVDRIYLQIIAPANYRYQSILPEQIQAINRSFIGAAEKTKILYIL